MVTDINNQTHPNHLLTGTVQNEIQSEHIQKEKKNHQKLDDWILAFPNYTHKPHEHVYTWNSHHTRQIASIKQRMVNVRECMHCIWLQFDRTISFFLQQFSITTSIRVWCGCAQLSSHHQISPAVSVARCVCVFAHQQMRQCIVQVCISRAQTQCTKAVNSRINYLLFSLISFFFSLNIKKHFLFPVHSVFSAVVLLYHFLP